MLLAPFTALGLILVNRLRREAAVGALAESEAREGTRPVQSPAEP
jgi:hypothetical protein